MKKDIQINTSDKCKIYGTLDSNGNSSLMIFVHGITGNKDEHHYFNAVPFFAQNDFDTFRFNFYCRDKEARPLSESSITSHANDLKTIIDFFKDKYENLILVGHSLGALVILNTELSNISKLVLWDSTTGFENLEDKDISYYANLNKYILNWRMDIIVGKQMIDEWKNTDIEQLIKKISIPCKFIFAGNCDKYESWKPYLKDIKVRSEVVVINGASHGFIEAGAEERLFEETLKWINI